MADMANTSWNWLAPRFILNEIRAAAASKVGAERPCLPTIEPLGDRVMLSATLSSDSKLPTAGQILVGLVKAELDLKSESSLLGSELDALKIASKFGFLAGEKLQQDANFLADSFVKIDNILYR